MCFSFNSAEAREDFRRDEEAYMRRFRLNDEQARAIHVPAIGGAIAKGLQQEPYWKPFFDGFLPSSTASGPAS